jgi:hypothetical protein
VDQTGFEVKGMFGLSVTGAGMILKKFEQFVESGDS